MTHSILAVLNQLQLLSDALLVNLAQEREALATSDRPAIEELAERKRITLGHLEQTTARWEQSLRQSSAGRFGIGNFSVWLATLPSAERAALEQAWGALRTTLDECRRANLVNGRVIAISRRSVERNLNIVRGQQPHEKLYTASGQATGYGLRQPGHQA